MEHSHPGYTPDAEAAALVGRKRGILNVALGYRYPGAPSWGGPGDAGGAGRAQADRRARQPRAAPVAGPGGRPHLHARPLRALLVLLASPHSPWLAAAAEVAAGLPAPLDAYGVGEGADLVPEPGADWAEAHGITPDGAVLVRPDGFVAWRHEGAAGNPATTLRDAVATLLSRA